MYYLSISLLITKDFSMAVSIYINKSLMSSISFVRSPHSEKKDNYLR